MNGSFGVMFGSCSNGNSNLLIEIFVEGSFIGSVLGSVMFFVGQILYLGGLDVLFKMGIMMIGKDVFIDVVE